MNSLFVSYIRLLIL